MQALLDTMKGMTVLENSVTIKSAVKPEQEAGLRALADRIAASL